MRRRIRGLPLVAAALVAMATAQASTLDVRVPGSGGYNVRVTSLKEARFKTTVPQKYDFSCGSAATATLLTFQYGHPVSEAEVFKRMFALGDQKRIRAEGFSLLDMQRYLSSQGYLADGFELPLDKLLEEGLPAIVLLNDRGYRHFVVVKGLKGGRVLLGDPARGTRAMSRERFDRLWDNRVLFVVHNRREIAQFNHPRDWRTAPLAPMDTAIPRQGLQNVVLPRRGPGDI
jgi:predicted double-glycine peptidase